MNSVSRRKVLELTEVIIRDQMMAEMNNSKGEQKGSSNNVAPTFFFVDYFMIPYALAVKRMRL